MFVELQDNNEMARTLVSLGDGNVSSEEQRKYFEKALANFKEASKSEVAATLVKLANAQSPRNYAKKCEHLEQALDIYKIYYGEYHPQVARTLSNAANAYGSLELYPKKRKYLEQALIIFEYQFNQIEEARTLVNLASAYGKLKDYDKKQKHLKRALEIYEKHSDPCQAEIAETLFNLGDREPALKICEKQYAPCDIAKLFDIDSEYGSLEYCRKKRKNLQKAIDNFETIYRLRELDRAENLTDFAEKYGELGDYVKQCEQLEEAMSIYKRNCCPKGEHITETSCLLDDAYRNLKSYTGMSRNLENNMAQLVREHPNNTNVTRILTNVAEGYGSLGNYSKKYKYLQRAYEILENPNTVINDHDEQCARAGENLQDFRNTRKELDDELLIFKEKNGHTQLEMAKALTGFANAYGSLGNYTRKHEYLERALDIFEEHHGPHDIEVARKLVSLGDAYGSSEDYTKQRKYLVRALDIFEDHYDHHELEVARILTNLADACGRLADCSHRSYAYLERALEIKELYYEKNHPEVAIALSNLANAYGSLQDYKRKKNSLERAFHIFEQHYGIHDVSLAITSTNLADTWGSLKDYKVQREHLKRALVIFERHYGIHDVRVAITLTNLADTCRSLEDYAKKREYLERALAILKEHYDLHDVRVARILRNLAYACQSLKDHVNQLAYLDRAFIIFNTGSHTAEVIGTLVDLGNAHRDLGAHRKECEYREQAFKMLRELHGRHHAERETALADLINAYESFIDDPQITIEDLKKALDIFEEHAPNHSKMARILTNVAYAHGSSGDFFKQRQCLKKALDIEIAGNGEYYPQVAITLLNLGNAYGNLGDDRTKLQHLERALNIFQNHYRRHPEIVYPSDAYESLTDYRNRWSYLKAITLVNLGDACGNLGNYPEQFEYLDLALTHLQFLFPGNHTKVARALIKVADAWGNLNQYEQQCGRLEQALHMNKLLYGDYSTEVEITLEKLVEACGNSNQDERRRGCLDQISIINEKRGQAS